jgi:hypothetical protein
VSTDSPNKMSVASEKNGNPAQPSPRPEGGASHDGGVTVHFSIDDLNPDTKYDLPMKQLINSPRTLEACRRQGVDLREIEPMSE